MNPIVGVRRFVDSHMITTYKLLETYKKKESAKLPFWVTELITSEQTKVTTIKKRTSCLTVALLNVNFLRKYEEAW